MAFFLAEEDVDSRADGGHQSIHLPQRRDHRLVNHFAGLFHFVHGAIQQFVGADDLQPCAVDSVGERSVNAFKLIAHQRLDSETFSVRTSIFGRNSTIIARTDSTFGRVLLDTSAARASILAALWRTVRKRPTRIPACNTTAIVVTAIKTFRRVSSIVTSL